MSTKKVLIISMTCGEGHNNLAKTVVSALNDEGVETKSIQLYGFSKKRVDFENNLFLAVYTNFPGIYSKIWHSQRNRNPKRKYKGYMSTVIKACKDYILKEIQDYNPDAVVTTHNNAGAVVSYLREENLIDKKIKLFGLGFDYCRCPLWETNLALDYVFLTHEELIDEYVNLGFNKEQLLPYGIPVHKRFTQNVTKEEARKDLGIDQEKFVVVLYSGGNCISPNFPLVKALLKAKGVPSQIVAVCGRNEKQKKLIDDYIAKHNITNVTSLGFTNDLDKYFRAADVVFTRGGGAGITEQININVPFVFREKLILNEKINKELFKELGLGLGIERISEATAMLETLYANPEMLKKMTECSKAFSRPDARKNITNKILSEIA